MNNFQLILILLAIGHCISDSLSQNFMSDMYQSKWSDEQWRYHISRWLSLAALYIVLIYSWFDKSDSCIYFTIIMGVLVLIMCHFLWRAFSKWH